ncbi:MAG: DsbE family thiol:disulfide interchange protein [Pseudomonadota bacterium]
MKRLKLFLPLALFLVLAGFLFRGLSLDPQALPSALIDRPLPRFELAVLGDGGKTVTEAAMVGEVALVNIWATWCASCRVEHPFLTELARSGLPIFGINYKDEDDKALGWLAQLGNPYRFSVVDREGLLGLDLGVYGAPETYVVDARGVIRYRHVGVVNEAVWQNTLQPIVAELRRTSDPS